MDVPVMMIVIADNINIDPENHFMKIRSSPLWLTTITNM